MQCLILKMFKANKKKNRKKKKDFESILNLSILSSNMFIQQKQPIL